MASNTSLTDTTGQLPQVGSDLGDFLSNLTPAIVGFVFILAIVGGVIGIIGAVIFVIKKALSRK